jgi:hypothetical protein
MSNLSLLLVQALNAQADNPNAARRREHIRALRRPADIAPVSESIAVRILGEADRPALARLAGRDSAEVPTGEVLGAQVGSTLVAALSLTSGAAIADPFRPSGSALELLRLRARQIGAPRRGLRRLRRRSRERSCASLAGSPPGAGGKLLQL